MPVDDLHRQVARIALGAAARHGFALGGGNALIAHGIIDRPTEDVDLFTDKDGGVAAAAGVVEAALRAHGYTAEREVRLAELAEVFYGLEDGLAEWVITAPDGRQAVLQLARIDRDRRPVTMDIGPVLDLEDVVGSKVCALAGHREVTDASNEEKYRILCVVDGSIGRTIDDADGRPIEGTTGSLPLLSALVLDSDPPKKSDAFIRIAENHGRSIPQSSGQRSRMLHNEVDAAYAHWGTSEEPE